MNDERRLKGQYAAYRKMGYEAGSAEGRAEGRSEGMAEGRTEQRNEIITRLHSKGMSLEQISEMLDISLDEIQTILTKK